VTARQLDEETDVVTAVLIVWAAGIPGVLLLSASVTSRRRRRADRAHEASPAHLASLPLLSSVAVLSSRPAPTEARRARTPGCR
jgi:hypothetical protein